jgi:hypothetical protein
MKHLKTIPYSEVNFRFISHHYDLHLEGTCMFNNKLCYFFTHYPDWDKENDCWHEAFTMIYKLSIYEKCQWILKQWFFEKCVGYHCSYENKDLKTYFYYRNPKWLYKFLFVLYYKVTEFFK